MRRRGERGEREEQEGCEAPGEENEGDLSVGPSVGPRVGPSIGPSVTFS